MLDAERLRGVDHLAQMCVDLLALRVVRMEVVRVVGERRDARRRVARASRAPRRRRGVDVDVRDAGIAALLRARRGPARDLEHLVAVRRRPRRHLVERPVARRQPSAVRASRGHLHPSLFCRWKARRPRRARSRRGRRGRSGSRQPVRPRQRRGRRRGTARGTCRQSPRHGLRAGASSDAPRRLISAALRSSVSFGVSRCPSHSSSGRSPSQASALREPLTSKPIAFLRPADTCETTHEPRAPPRKRTRMCAKSSVVISTSTRSPPAAEPNVSTSPTGRCAHRDRRREVGEDLLRLRARSRTARGRASASRCRRPRAARRPCRARAASSSPSAAAASPADSRRARSTPRRARPACTRTRASCTSG